MPASPVLVAFVSTWIRREPPARLMGVTSFVSGSDAAKQRMSVPPTNPPLPHVSASAGVLPLRFTVSLLVLAAKPPLPLAAQLTVGLLFTAVADSARVK